MAEIAKTTDHVDILFANAGATWGEKFDTHPEKMFSKVMDLNVKSIFYTIQKYVRSFIVANLVLMSFPPLTSFLDWHPFSPSRLPSTSPPASSSPLLSRGSASARLARTLPLATLPPRLLLSISLRTWLSSSARGTFSPMPSRLDSTLPRWPRV